MSCNCENEDEKKNALNRRSFLSRLTVGIGAAIGGFLSLPLITAMLDPVTRKERNVWRNVGKLHEFKKGETRMVTFKNATVYDWSTKLQNTAAYVRRQEDGKLLAFAVNCAHLGCPVRWDKQSQLFLCPCHGGVFYKDGSRAAGPPPRGMYHYKIRLKGDDVQIATQGIPITNIGSGA